MTGLVRNPFSRGDPFRNFFGDPFSNPFGDSFDDPASNRFSDPFNPFRNPFSNFLKAFPSFRSHFVFGLELSRTAIRQIETVNHYYAFAIGVEFEKFTIRNSGNLCVRV